MTSRDFAYWLQGFFELSPKAMAEGMTPAQTDLVRRHLALVFAHEIDPSAGGPEHQALLNEIHHGKPEPTGLGTPHFNSAPGHGRPHDAGSGTLLRC